MNSRAPFAPARSRGFSLMEMLVVVAVLVVLLAIGLPTYSLILTHSCQATALSNMRSLSGAFDNYTSENNGNFPLEDASGPNTWEAAAVATNEKVWYNALPRLLGMRSVADYSYDPRGFYTKANILFLPGAKYPEGRLERPLFAIAMNSRLQRKNNNGVKADERISKIANPSRTVIFFEQGIRGEKKSSSVQGSYDGAPKGTARSFIGRYNGRGIVTFLDGHAEVHKPDDLLTETGALPFPQTDFIWTADPSENPN